MSFGGDGKMWNYLLLFLPDIFCVFWWNWFDFLKFDCELQQQTYYVDHILFSKNPVPPA